MTDILASLRTLTQALKAAAGFLEKLLLFQLQPTKLQIKNIHLDTQKVQTGRRYILIRSEITLLM
jgi:hypothetical protein